MILSSLSTNLWVIKTTSILAHVVVQADALDAFLSGSCIHEHSPLCVCAHAFALVSSVAEPWSATKRRPKIITQDTGTRLRV